MSSSKVSPVSGRGTTPVGAGAGVSRPQSGGQGGASQSSRSDNSASVQITTAASQLAELEQALRTHPAIDQGRVESISLALEQGSYTISPEHIADQLMYLEHALGSVPIDEQ